MIARWLAEKHQAWQQGLGLIQSHLAQGAGPLESPTEEHTE